MKICKDRFNLDIGKYSYKNRVVDEWNSLPQDIVDAPMVLILLRINLIAILCTLRGLNKLRLPSPDFGSGK